MAPGVPWKSRALPIVLVSTIEVRAYESSTPLEAGCTQVSQQVFLHLHHWRWEARAPGKEALCWASPSARKWGVETRIPGCFYCASYNGFSSHFNPCSPIWTNSAQRRLSLSLSPSHLWTAPNPVYMSSRPWVPLISHGESLIPIPHPHFETAYWLFIFLP